MNEFIVWDEEKREFFDNRNDFKIDADGDVFYKGTHFIDFNGEPIHKAFRAIGKTDDTPEQNKIYADCSIVEFDLVDFNLADEETDIRNTYKGYFKYNLDTLSYMMFFNNGDKFLQQIVYCPSRFQNLKVIGTLQENKDRI